MRVRGLFCAQLLARWTIHPRRVCAFDLTCSAMNRSTSSKLRVNLWKHSSCVISLPSRKCTSSTGKSLTAGDYSWAIGRGGSPFFMYGELSGD
jgi:hypothetical protein